MPSDEELRSAILEHVEHGGYPDSEDVAAAELPPSALPGLLEAIARAKEDVKSEIREISQEAAPDVDGWIAQAKQLQADIERSRATAHDIVQQAETGKALRASADDASSKVALLEKELQFNETLSATLERIRSISGILDNVQDAAVQEQMPQALEQLDKANDVLAHLGPFKTTRVFDLLQERAAQMTAAIVEIVTECWDALLAVDTAVRQVTIKDEVQRGEIQISINAVVEALSKLNLLDKFASRFSRNFENTILSPRLSPGDFGVPQILSDGDVIRISGHMGDTSVLAALGDLQHITEYLSTRLPSSVSIPLSEKLMPSAMSCLISQWLEPSIPTTLNGLQNFQDILSHVLTLADAIGDLGWAGRAELIDWVDRVPRTWLAKRKEAALANVRRACFRGVLTRKQVERVETQTISRGDALAVTGNGTDDDWNAGWSDDESKPSTVHPGPEPENADGEEDASAWGFDDEEAQASSDTQQQTSKGDDADGADEEAWGWGDEDASAQAAPPLPARRPKAPVVHDGETRSRAAERELTLREHYAITGVPSSILEIITQAVSDAETLAQPDFSASPIAPAGAGLYSIPTLVLAMYRATAASCYSKDPAGNMLIYNDCTRLCEELTAFLSEQKQRDQSSDLPPSARPSIRLRLDPDIAAIESFGKRAYGKEMESQRTILRDLLDTAQGFSNSTIHPFAAECDNAISMTVDRIREVNRQWKDVLSRSALLQSLGSLLSTVTNKMMNDIKDMSDISEEESKRLKHFCDEISKLSELFMQERPDGEKADMTGVYTPNWLKFQYLAEILESSLADIKWMWTEGELKLEFEADEIIELIEALFAESPHRRSAIAEIRRASRGR